MNEQTKRSVAYVLLGAIGAFCAVIVLGFVANAWGQTPNGTTAPPAPRETTLTFPNGWTTDGDRVTLKPETIDAIVRSQPRIYLQGVADSMLPKVPAGMKVGTITGKSIDPVRGVYLAGWTVPTAAKVEVRFDGKTPSTFVPVTLTDPPIAGTFTLPIPEALQDGKPHRIYARAIRASGTVVGPLDNATYSAQYVFTIPAPAPAMKVGRIVAVDKLTRTLLIETVPPVTHVEILIDGKIAPVWYYGTREVKDGKVAVTLDPLAIDGAAHFVEVRAYDRSSGKYVQLAPLDNSRTFTYQ